MESLPSISDIEASAAAPSELAPFLGVSPEV